MLMYNKFSKQTSLYYFEKRNRLQHITRINTALDILLVSHLQI